MALEAEKIEEQERKKEEWGKDKMRRLADLKR